MSLTTESIAGLQLVPLRQIVDDRGAVLHILRRDSPSFTTFGEVYCSEVYPGMVKAWHLHRRIPQQLAVVAGRIHLVVYDGRQDSITREACVEFELGRPDSYYLTIIPAGTWYGFGCVSDAPALVVSVLSEPHDPDEVQRLPATSELVPYSWVRR